MSNSNPIAISTPIPLITEHIPIQELTQDDDVADHPTDIAITLKRHQLTLLHAAIKLETTSFQRIHGLTTVQLKTKLGVLCDQVGAGKSFVMLSLVVNDKLPVIMEPDIQSLANGMVVTCTLAPKHIIQTNVIVISQNLVTQWKNYIVTFQQSLYEHTSFLTNEKDYKEMYKKPLAQNKLIVVTLTMYKRLHHMLRDKKYTVRRVFYDEIENGCSSPIESVFTWFVTSSFANLLYPSGLTRYNDQYSMYVNYISGIQKNGFLKETFKELKVNLDQDALLALFLKNKDEYVRDSMGILPIDVIKIMCKNNAVNILNGLIDSDIIDCINANDIQGAIMQINKNHHKSEDNIVSIMVQKLQKSLNDLKQRLDYTSSVHYESECDKLADLESIKSRQHDVEGKILHIRERITNTNSCHICFDTIENKCVVSCCSNAYCFKCLTKWLSQAQSESTCPLCKAYIDIQKNVFVVDIPPIANTFATSSYPHINELHPSNSKMQNLEHILAKSGINDKILILSAHDNTFNVMATLLTRLDIKYAHLKRNSFVIKRTIDNYKNGDTKVLLFTATHFGPGLNLENTTDIIMFHKFNTDLEKQVIGGANRVGRKSPLKVWYLLNENESL